MINMESIVRLWYKTQRGHIKKCRKAQMEFSDVMWELCEELNIKDVIKGNAKQIEIVAEIKERIESMEIERVSAVDLGIIPYEA